MKNKSDDEIIDYILRKCARNCSEDHDPASLIWECLEDKNHSANINALWFRIKDTMIKNNLALIKSDYNIQANEETIVICNRGGYTKYIEKKRREDELKISAGNARYKMDVFLLKTRWMPHIISFFALLISILAFLQSIGFLC